MSTAPPETVLVRSWWTTFPGLALALGIVSGAWAWQLIALPVLTLSDVTRHVGHVPLTYLHVVSGTILLAVGALNLYIGSTRRHFRFHRQIGYTYLIGGAPCPIVALLVTIGTVHNKTAAPFAFDFGAVTNTGFSLASLSLAWLACAALGLRAAINLRFNTHRDWMIRSYVLAWSFVLCRVVEKIPSLAGLAGIGNGQSFIWLSWLGPLALAEMAIQWQAGARQAPREGRS